MVRGGSWAESYGMSTQDSPLPPRDDEPMAEPRRLTRSTESKYVAGVAGGLGRYFGLDPVLFRVAFGVSMVFGGIGIVAYIALWVFLPTDDGEPAFMDNRSRATTVVAMAILAIAAFSVLGPPSFVLGPGLLACAVVIVLAVLLWRAIGGGRGDDPARMVARGTLMLLLLVAALGAATGIGVIAAVGGGTAVAILSVVAGLGLVAAGLLGGPRWLILPVIVLVLPLAVVSAAGIDLHGGVGPRHYRPVSVADLRPEYRLGVGDLNLDLRKMDLPAGTTNVKLSVGIGDAKVRVPNGVCVTTDAAIGVGATDLPDDAKHGFDIAVPAVAATPPEGRPLLHVDADLGVGYLQVDRDDFGSWAKDCA
jgi:phage shock protein PspC (stress-responsive transcriptional regulator)